MPNHIEHHGILGQKWGVRRYQNYDGTRIKKENKSYNDQKNDSGMSYEQKKYLKTAAIGLISTAAILGGGIAAYKYSEKIKNDAGNKIVNEGNEYVSELMKKVGEYSVLAGAMGPLPGQNYRYMLYSKKAVDAQKLAEDYLHETVKKANDISSSFIKSYKYLHK